MTDDPLWEQVKQLEEDRRSAEGEILRIKATLAVNFGPKSKNPIIGWDYDTAHGMMVAVLEKLTKKGTQ